MGGIQGNWASYYCRWMDGTELERIIAFDHHFERAQSSSIVEVGWGFAHLQSDFPHSFSHNRVVVTGDVSVAEVLAETERVLGGAGLTHRYVKFDDEVAGEAAIQAFVAAGYEHQPLVTMIHNGESSDTSNDSQSNPVSEVTVDQLRPALIRDWKVELPGTPDEVINQLADRVELYSRGAETAFLAVFDGDDVASRADLYLDRQNGIAQFENLVTHADYRGRGHASALVREGLRRSGAAGCGLSFLVADLNDWPREWYSRLGYVEARQSHEFILS